MRIQPALFATALILTRPNVLWAHTSGGQNGLLSGIFHPLGGLDHLLAMVGVGLWASQSGKKSVWTLSVTFLVLMSMGGGLGFSGIPLIGVEAGILASVVVVGLLAASALKLPHIAGCGLVGMFALFHGHAHGTEMPASIHPALYAAGFVASTGLLLLNGALFGSLMRELNLKIITRLAGGLIAIGGMVLIMS